MTEATTQNVEVQKEITGKMVVSFTKPTPMWATWIFRVVFCLTAAATMIITAEPSIPNDLKVRIMLYMKAADFAIWFLGKGIGIDKSQFNQPSP